MSRKCSACQAKTCTYVTASSKHHPPLKTIMNLPKAKRDSKTKKKLSVSTKRQKIPVRRRKAAADSLENFGFLYCMHYPIYFVNVSEPD